MDFCWLFRSVLGICLLLIVGTGMVMLKPFRMEESFEFPLKEDAWKRTVMFGLRPERYSPRNFSA
jgi:hypothetical protein